MNDIIENEMSGLDSLEENDNLKGSLGISNNKGNCVGLVNVYKKFERKWHERNEGFDELKSHIHELEEKLTCIEGANQKIKEEIVYNKQNIDKQEIALKEQCSELLRIKDHHKYENHLYFNITRLKWNLNCPSDEIRGYIASDPPKTFELDLSKHSQFFISNHLWSLI